MAPFSFQNVDSFFVLEDLFVNRYEFLLKLEHSVLNMKQSNAYANCESNENEGRTSHGIVLLCEGKIRSATRRRAERDLGFWEISDWEGVMALRVRSLKVLCPSSASGT